MCGGAVGAQAPVDDLGLVDRVTVVVGTRRTGRVPATSDHGRTPGPTWSADADLVRKLRLVERGAEDEPAIALLGPADRGYVESLAPGPERDTIIASRVRYRKPEALQPGDALPLVTLRRADDLEPRRARRALPGPPAAARLRQLHLTALPSPVGRRREPPSSGSAIECDFAFVYVAEAHADDEWQLPANLEEGAVLEPADDARRATAAGARDRAAPRPRHGASSRRHGQPGRARRSPPGRSDSSSSARTRRIVYPRAARARGRFSPRERRKSSSCDAARDEEVETPPSAARG